MSIAALWHRLLHSATWIRPLGALALSLSLGGCLVSTGALFDPKEAVAPLAPGLYRAEQFKESNWAPLPDWKIQSIADGYFIEDEDSKKFVIRLFELEQDLYIADILMHDEHYYAYAQIAQGSVVVSGVDCGTYKRSDIAQKYPPTRETGGIIPLCYFVDRQVLFEGLSRSRQAAVPVYRLTPIPVLAKTETPVPQVQAEVESTSLTVCNKSPATVSAIFHHQHRFDSSKQVLSGWYEIAGNECRNLGRFPRNGLSIFGVAVHGSRRLEWEGKSKAYCIAQRQTYRVATENERCVPGEAAKVFADVSATSDITTFTFGWSGQR